MKLEWSKGLAVAIKYWNCVTRPSGKTVNMKWDVVM